MANTKLSNMSAQTVMAATDLLYANPSPYSAGNDRKITFANFEASLTLANQVGYSLLGLKASPLSQFAATTSAQLAGVISDETGSGLLVFATSPVLTTPNVGVATATSVNKVAITAPATSATLTIADGKTATVSNTLTFTGTDTSSVAFGTGGTVLYTASVIPLTVGTTTIASGATTRILYDNAGVLGEYTITGTGTVVAMQTSPVFTTPTLGVASATSLATSAATPLLLTNGQLVNVALTSQTVGATTLTIPNFASVSDTFAFITLAQTLSNKTFVAPVLGAATGTSLSLSAATALTIGTASSLSGAIVFQNSTNANTLTLKSGATSGSYTITLPLAVASAGQVLTDAAGNGVLSWATAAGGVSWGNTASGTTADGLGLTLSNSADASASALNLTAGNTQGNVNALEQINIGTSANVLGLLIKGTGSTTGGALGTGKNHLTLWANVASSAVKVISIGNGTSYTEQLNMLANGKLVQTGITAGTGFDLNIGDSASANAVGLSITITATQSNNGIFAQKIKEASAAVNVGGTRYEKFTSGPTGWSSSEDLDANYSPLLIAGVSNNRTQQAFGIYDGSNLNAAIPSVKFFYDGRAMFANTGNVSSALVSVSKYLSEVSLNFTMISSAGTLVSNPIIGCGSTTQAFGSDMTLNTRHDTLVWEFTVGNASTTKYTTARTTDYMDVVHTRLHGNNSVTDNFDHLLVNRVTTKNGTGTTLAQGSVIKVKNDYTQTSGTLTDSVIVAKLVQNASSTGDILQCLISTTNQFGVSNVGKVTTYNAVATAGLGLHATRAQARSTAQTAAVSSVATFTVGAADSSFIVSANLCVTTSTAFTIAVQVDYTDETNTAQTLTLNFAQLAGAIVSSITNVTGAGPYEGIPNHIRCKASTAITVKTTGTFTTVTYNVEGAITQIA